MKFIQVTKHLKLEIVSLLDRKTQLTESVLRDLGTGYIIGVFTQSTNIPSPYNPVGGYQALNELLESGFVLGSMLFGFKCDHVHTDVYTLLPYKYERKRELKCVCCGKHFIGRQWHNQDNGWSLGDCCVEDVRKSFTFSGEKIIDFERTYGIEGYNYLIKRN